MPKRKREEKKNQPTVSIQVTRVGDRLFDHPSVKFHPNHHQKDPVRKLICMALRYCALRGHLYALLSGHEKDDAYYSIRAVYMRNTQLGKFVRVYPTDVFSPLYKGSQFHVELAIRSVAFSPRDFFITVSPPNEPVFSLPCSHIDRVKDIREKIREKIAQQCLFSSELYLGRPGVLFPDHVTIGECISAQETTLIWSNPLEVKNKYVQVCDHERTLDIYVPYQASMSISDLKQHIQGKERVQIESLTFRSTECNDSDTLESQSIPPGSVFTMKFKSNLVYGPSFDPGSTPEEISLNV